MEQSLLMELKRVQSAARKALIAADPSYYSWPADRQELFRATMDNAAENRVESVLLKELLGIACTAKNAGDIWRDLPIAELNPLNWAKLLTRGIGQDMILVNESMAENTSLLDFDTLYDYDYKDYLFQEKANSEQFSGYQKREYFALRFLCWVRLIINDQFYYANFYSLAGYLTCMLEDKGSDLIEALIPHDYVEGKNQGKPVKGGFLWDMEILANGLEKQLEELKHRWYHYLQQRWEILSQEFSHNEPAVFCVDDNQIDERHRNFIFNNEAALRKIRWRYFLEDFDKLQDEFSKVTELETKELEAAKRWLQETHKDIMDNFDPDVLKLRKKYRVVIAPGALDGLIGDEDE